MHADCYITYAGRDADRYRIFENQHLLDATEIFRKLNVHKKVRFPFATAPLDLASMIPQPFFFGDQGAAS